jgi:hypothetical protein
MYVERRWPDNRMKSGRIARVHFSKSGRTLYLGGKSFIALGMGEYMESESRESYWFSGPRKDGNDRKGTSLSVPIEIDDDARVEYWADIRQQPKRVGERTT